MNSIFELLQRLPPIVETAITCYSKNQVLFPLKDATYSLQLAWYWWKNADTELNQNQDDIILEAEEGQAPPLMKAPTLISTKEQIDYMTEQLKELSKSAQEYIDSSVLPPSVQYKLDRGYDRTMEAMFNIETANTHYEEITRNTQPKRLGS